MKLRVQSPKSAINLLPILPLIYLVIRFPALAIPGLGTLISYLLLLMLIPRLSQPWHKYLSLVIFTLLILIYILSANFLFLPLILIILQLGFYIFLCFKQKKWPEQDFFKLFHLGSALIIICILTFCLTSSLSTKREETKVDKDSQQLSRKINFYKAESLTKTKSLANDQFIKQLLTSREYTQLTNLSQNLMVSQKLSYLVITDQMGNVLINAHSPKKIGENFFLKFPETRYALMSGFQGFLQDVNAPILVSGAPIKDDKNTSLGLVFAGYQLDSGLAQKINGNSRRLTLFFSSGGSVIGQSGPEVNLSSVIPQDNSHFFSYKNIEYLTSSQPITSSLSKNIGTLSSVQKSSRQENLVNTFTVYFSLSCLLFLIGLVTIRNTKPNFLNKLKDFFQRIAKPSLLTRLYQRLILHYQSLILIFLLFAVSLLAVIIYENHDFQNPVTKKTTTRSSHRNYSVYSKLSSSYLDKNSALPYQVYLAGDRSKIISLIFKINYSSSMLEFKNLVSTDSCQIEPSQANSLLVSCTPKSKPSEPLLSLNFQTKNSGITTISLDSNASYFVTSGGQTSFASQKITLSDNLIIK